MAFNRPYLKQFVPMGTLLLALQLAPFSSPTSAQELVTAGALSGLLFTWQNAEAPNEIADAKGNVRLICRVQPHGLAKFGRFHVMDVTGGWFVAEGAESEISDACRASGEFTFEAAITPTKGDTIGDAPIVTIGSDAGEASFSLVQRNERLVARLRTSMGVYPCDFGKLEANTPTHVVVTYSSGRLSTFVDGKVNAIFDAEEADLGNWTPQPLLFGREGEGKAGWAGTIEAVSIFSRAHEADEVATRYQSHRGQMKDRSPVDRAVVAARLVETSETPKLAEISPYRRALAAYTYEVRQVVAGTCDAKKIQVAHWVILDRRVLPNRRTIGETYRIAIEPFEAHEQLEAERLVSDSEEFDLPLFYDVDP